MTIQTFARTLGIVSFVLGSLVLQGCSDDDAPGVAIESIEVTPANPHVANGTTKAFAATAHLSDGTTEVVTEQASWSSAAPAVATISDAAGSKGVALAHSVGTATIQATLQGVSGSTTLTVDAVTLSRVEIHPLAPSIAKGTSQQFQVTAILSDQTSQDVTDDATWNSSNTGVATINDTGLAHGVTPGSSIITASYQGKADSTTLTVTTAAITSISVTPATPSLIAGTTQQFHATADLSDDTTQDVTATVVWSSSNPSVATVSNAAETKGRVTGVSAGTSTITATIQGTSGSTLVTVTPATLSSIAITPTNPSVAKGSDQQFTATATFSNNQTQDVTAQTTWTSSNAAVATISNDAATRGRAHAVNPGTSTIGAAFQGKTATTTMTVTAAALASIEVRPASPSVAKGNSQQFSAVGVFTDGTNQDLTNAATWSSSDPTVAEISNAAGSRGLAAALKAGTSTISATAGGKTGSTPLTVTAATLTGIQVSPANAQLAKGFALQFHAIGVFSDNSNADITDQVSWISTNTDAATISNAAGSKGLASGVDAGTTTIIAKQGSLQGSSTLTVKNITLQSVAVTPAAQTLPKGTEQQYTATGTFSDSSHQDLTSQVTWASSDATIATVSNAAGSKGLVTAVNKGGPVNITATHAASSKSGSTTLTVSDAELVSIAITPANATLPKGVTGQYRADGTFTDDSVKDVTTSVTWSSSNPAVATIDNSAGHKGQVTGVDPGIATITATSGSVSGTAQLTVTAAQLVSLVVTPDNKQFGKGLQVQYHAVGTFSDQSTREMTDEVTWQSSDPSVAAVSNEPATVGVVTMVKVGNAVISASTGGVSDNTNVQVTNATLQSIAVTPAGANVAKGTTQQMTATGRFSDNTTQDITSQVTWSSSDTNIADVSNADGSEGLVVARDQGTVTITATLAGKSGSTPLTVSSAIVQALSVTPASGSVAVGDDLQYHAVAQLSDGSQRDVTESASWATLNPGVATVSNTAGTKGLVTGVAAGSTTVRATLNAFAGTAAVTVTSTK